MPIGLPELGIILLIILLIFGPKRLPGLGKQLGTGMREFKDSITGKDGDDNDDTRAEAPQLAPAAVVPPPAAPEPPEAAAAPSQPEDRPAAGA